MWTFPLKIKSGAYDTLRHIFAYVKTQFSTTVCHVQCDNGGEFDNLSMRDYLVSHGIILRMSCPHTSQQNGKAERVIHTTNDVLRTLLFQASMSPSYWVEALHMATYLLNLQPTKALNFGIPHEALFGTPLDYTNLRVFGCLCYSKLSATAPHKLAPCSTACIFLGYPTHHKGYRCLDISTRRLIISRQVLFDE